MIIKYKLGDLSKDFGIANKDTISLLGSFGEGKKHTTNLTDDELNYFFEQITKQHMVDSFEAFIGSAVVKTTPPKIDSQPEAAATSPVVQTTTTAATEKQEAKAKRPSGPAPSRERVRHVKIGKLIVTAF